MMKENYNLMNKKIKDKNGKPEVKLTPAQLADNKKAMLALGNCSDIPQDLLAKLSEFSPQGFALFTMDEKGNLITNTRFDNDSAVITLCWHIMQWAGAQNYMNEEMFKRGFFGNIQENGEDFQPH